jgi:hypothetical protein
MTFIENIYKQVSDLTYLSTDDFSINWLQQSRSYYSSNKTRGIEASTTVLVKLMNKLTEQKEKLEFNNKKKHMFYLTNANKYDDLAKLVGREIASRSIKSNIANKRVKDLLVNIVTELNEQRNHNPLPIIIGF